MQCLRNNAFYAANFLSCTVHYGYNIRWVAMPQLSNELKALSDILKNFDSLSDQDREKAVSDFNVATKKLYESLSSASVEIKNTWGETLALEQLQKILDNIHQESLATSIQPIIKFIDGEYDVQKLRREIPYGYSLAKNKKPADYKDLHTSVESCLQEMLKKYGAQDLALLLQRSNIVQDSTIAKDEYLEKMLLAHGAIPLDDGFLTLNLTDTSAGMILQNISSRKGGNFNPTLVSVVNEEDNEAEYEHLIEQDLTLIQEYFREVFSMIADKKIDVPMEKTFIIKSRHWSNIHVEFTSDESGNPKMNILLLDSVPNISDYCNKNSALYKFRQKFLSAAIQTFGDDSVKIYDSQVTLQKDGKSCPLYALLYSRFLFSYDQGAFHKAFGTNIFKFLATHNKEQKTMPNGIKAVLVSELPAKFLQATQNLGGIPTIYLGQQASSYKEGGRLEEKLLKNVGQKYSGRNAFTENWYDKMRVRLNNFFRTPDIQSRLAELQEVKYKFSPLALAAEIEVLKQKPKTTKGLQR